MGSRWLRNSVVYFLILVSIIAIIVAFFRPVNDDPVLTVDLIALLVDARAERVSRIEVRGDGYRVTLDDGSRYATHQDVKSWLRAGGADPSAIEVAYASPGAGDIVGVIIQLIPVLFFAAAMIWLVRWAARRT